MTKKKNKDDDLDDLDGEEGEDEEETPELDDPGSTYGIGSQKGKEQELDEKQARLPWHTNLCSVQLSREAPQTDARHTSIVGFIRNYHEAVTVESIKRNHGGGTYRVILRGPSKKTGKKVILGNVYNIVIGGDPYINNDTPKDELEDKKSGTEAQLLQELRVDRERESRRRDEREADLKQMVTDASSNKGESSTEVLTVIKEVVAQNAREGSASLERMQALSDRASESIRQASENHAREIRDMNERNREHIEQIRTDSRTQIDTMRDESGRDRRELRESIESRERALRDEADRRERDQRDDFSKRETYLRDQAAREEKTLRERLEEVKSDYREIKAQYESLRTDLQNSQFGLAKAEFAATLAAANTNKEEGGLEGMVKTMENAKAVQALMGGGGDDGGTISQILPLLNTEAAKRVGTGVGAVLGTLGAAVAPGAAQQTQQAQVQAQQQALAQQQAQQQPNPRRRVVRRRPRPVEEQPAEQPAPEPVPEQPPEPPPEPATEDQSAEAKKLMAFIQASTESGHTPQKLFEELTPLLGGPETVKRIVTVHPDTIISQTEEAAGEKFSFSAKRLLRETFKHARESLHPPVQ